MIPEHVRKQAMDAVAHKETTALIRAYGHKEMAHDFSGPPQPAAETPPGRLTDEIRKQAMDAVSHPETRARIQMGKDSGEVTAPITPTQKSLRLAERVAEMHISGQDRDSIQRDMTRDDFGR